MGSLFGGCKQEHMTEIPSQQTLVQMVLDLKHKVEKNEILITNLKYRIDVLESAIKQMKREDEEDRLS